MLAPRILDLEQSLTVNLDGLLNRVGMALYNALTLTPSTEDASATPEKEFVVDLEKLFLPEVLLYVCLLVIVLTIIGCI